MVNKSKGILAFHVDVSADAKKECQNWICGHNKITNGNQGQQNARTRLQFTGKYRNIYL
jgi:hypothetical protein